MTAAFSTLLKDSVVMPILSAENVSDAIHVASAIQKGGMNVIEVVIRTSAALDCISALKKEFPEMIIGAGTITTTELINDAKSAGAEFLISPSLTQALAENLLSCGIPVLPGVATPGEMHAAIEAGFNELKFFPAEIYGGSKTLKAVKNIYQGVSFCPTGGVNLDNLENYLSLDNVFAVGGSWLTPANAIKEKDWTQITQLTREAVELCQNR